MKRTKRFSGIILASAIALVFSACSIFLNDSDAGNVSITIGGSSGRTAAPAWLGSLELEDLAHTIQVFDANGVEKDRVDNLRYGETKSFSVTPGVYTFQVEAFYNGELIAEGSTKRTIRSGVNPAVIIPMGALFMEGTLTILHNGVAITEPILTGTELTAYYSGNESGVSFQWNKDQVSISGATGLTYTPITAGSYTVTVSLAGYNSETSVAVSVFYRGTGIETDPFIVLNVETLSHVGKPTVGGSYDDWTLNACYLQKADIDLSSIPNWTPIGNDSLTNVFIGIYDGGGFKIMNLRIDRPESSTGLNQGLFGFIRQPALIKNINLIDIDITGYNTIGGVAASVGSSATVKNCYVTGDVKGNSLIGGVAGTITGTVENCYFVGNVNGGLTGGVVAQNNGIVKNCYATGSVIGGNNAGGVVGRNSGLIENCYTTSRVVGSSEIGGVVGAFYSFGGGAETVKNCIALNQSVTTTENNSSTIGRVAGSETNVTLTNNYSRSNMDIRYNTDANGIGGNIYTPVNTVNASNNVDGANITAMEWNSAAWWRDTMLFDQDIWNIENGKLPTLKGVGGEQNPQVLP